MSIIKSLVCAVLLILHATNAEFFVNCLAAPEAVPEAALGCADVNKRVLDLLDDCSGSPMYYVGSHAETPPARHLRSREGERETTPREEVQVQVQEQSSERKLQGYCYSTNLNPGQQLFCCMYSANYYSYCASPTSGDRRLTKDKTAADLDGTLAVDEQAMERISNKCTNDFRKLARELPQCLGTDWGNLYCKSFVVIAA